MPKQNRFYQIWEKGRSLKLAVEGLFEDDEEGVSESETESQFAVVSVKIYKAEHLPNANRGILSHVKRRWSAEEEVFIDPYVKVLFAGQKASTSKKKRTTSPNWDEQIVFTTKFPLPSGPIVLLVRDDDFVVGNDIGAVSIPLDKISRSDDQGFLPTFGPCFVYLRDHKHPASEDVSYNGRLLITITTEIVDGTVYMDASPKVESIPPVPEGAFGYDSDFVLFACFQEASIIERKMAQEKDIRFSLQMGLAGREPLEMAFDDSKVTPSMSLKPMDKHYLYVPYENCKPCIWLKGWWPDDRKRMYMSNIISKMENKLKEYLPHIQKPLNGICTKNEGSNLKHLQDLENAATCYLRTLREYNDFYSGKTQLDSKRSRIYMSDMEDVINVSSTARTALNKTMLEGAVKKLNYLQQRMKVLADDPQSMMPDVVVWMECGEKRVGYAKMAARELLYAFREFERGVYCGKTRNLLFKPFGRREDGALLAKVECMLWLGQVKQMKHCLNDLPQGFDTEYGLDTPEDGNPIPQALIYFASYKVDHFTRRTGYNGPQQGALGTTEKTVFQLRAYIYQARSLPCYDLSHQPNCYARVFIRNHTQTTQTQENTVNPIWDEMLFFPEIYFYGDIQTVIDSPPVVIVDIIKYSTEAKSELLGRTIAPVKVNKNSRNLTTLKWYDSVGSSESHGQLLAAFELFPLEEGADVGPGGDADFISVLPIPPEIRPRFADHRIEILFWGLREMKRSHWKRIDRPRVDVECAGHVLSSSVIANYREHSNFINAVEYMDLALPEQEEYLPPLIIKLMDSKSFGRVSVIATYVLTSLQNYIFRPEMLDDVQSPSARISHMLLGVESVDLSVVVVQTVEFPWSRQEKKEILEEEEKEEIDWWSRYYISTGERPQTDETLCSIGPNVVIVPRGSLPRASILGLRAYRDAAASMDMRELEPWNTGEKDVMGFIVYPMELENVPEFGGLQEWLHSFELTKGKKAIFSPPREKVMTVFKGCFRVYKIPLLEPVMDPLLPVTEGQEGLFGGLPMNKPMKVLIRAYIVKAIDLKPSDVTNTTDPYIVMLLGRQRLSDKEHYISKQLNPVFGKCFEFVSNFPGDSILHVQLFDWNLMGTDDLIGETIIDLENRFYSRHRATCGLARVYEASGPNAWRDALKPTEILKKLCQENKLDGPHIDRRRIRIGNIIYEFGEGFGYGRAGRENMALCLLHRWREISPGKYSLVPEHIETRTLYHPKKPAEPQGQLVMWLDMFEEDTVPPSMPREISMRKPESYELRVIIWNTEEVVLADDAFFTGEKMSDIYVKGWLTGKEDSQMTDVHYRSLTGEGNFNWRFIFPFDYLAIERKIVIKKKVSVFSWDETEFKVPPFLELQVWDADHFSPDENLGSLSLDLNRFPRGAKTSKLCTLDILKKDGSVPQMSIFKQTRVKGWWPFCSRKAKGELELTGKVEAEIQLLTKEEAEKSPAGSGRKDPEALKEPKRPATSFINILNPLKTLRYAVWKNYKHTICRIIFVVALVLFLVLFCYSLPGYSAKKILKV